MAESGVGLLNLVRAMDAAAKKRNPGRNTALSDTHEAAAPEEGKSVAREGGEVVRTRVVRLVAEEARERERVGVGEAKME